MNLITTFLYLLEVIFFSALLPDNAYQAQIYDSQFVNLGNKNMLL